MVPEKNTRWWVFEGERERELIEDPSRDCFEKLQSRPPGEAECRGLLEERLGTTSFEREHMWVRAFCYFDMAWV